MRCWCRILIVKRSPPRLLPLFLCPSLLPLHLAPSDPILAGQGVLVTYPFDKQSGRLGLPTTYPLSEHDTPATGSMGSSIAAARMGHRPRHVCFSPDGTRLYVLHEFAK